MFLTSYNQYIFIHSAFDELITHTQSIYKSAALIADIQCTDLFHLHSPLQQYSATGKIIIRTNGSKDDKVNIRWSEASSFNSNFSSFYAHGGGSFTNTFRIMTFFNTGSFLYPFVAGIHILQQIVVGNYIFGYVHTNTG